MLERLPDALGTVDAVALVKAVFGTANALLPVLPETVVGALHAVVLAGVVYASDVQFVDVEGNRIQVFEQSVTTRDALLALLGVFVVLAVYGWWSQAVYDLFVLSGWQAFGVVCVETTWLVLSQTRRTLDRWTAAMVVLGAFLFAVPLFG